MELALLSFPFSAAAALNGKKRRAPTPTPLRCTATALPQNIDPNDDDDDDFVAVVGARKAAPPPSVTVTDERIEDI